MTEGKMCGKIHREHPKGTSGAGAPNERRVKSFISHVYVGRFVS